MISFAGFHPQADRLKEQKMTAVARQREVDDRAVVKKEQWPSLKVHRGLRTNYYVFTAPLATSAYQTLIVHYLGLGKSNFLKKYHICNTQRKVKVPRLTKHNVDIRT